MNHDHSSCSLCGLPLKLLGFSLKIGAEVKYFCCEGCQGVYQLLHGDRTGAIIDGHTPGKTKKNTFFRSNSHSE